MELAVAEFPFGGDAGFLRDGIAIPDFPFFSIDPLGKILAVKQDKGVGGRRSHLARMDDLGLRPGNPALIFLNERRLNEQSGAKDQNHCSSTGPSAVSRKTNHAGQLPGNDGEYRKGKYFRLT
jgi:hypothetical protein